MNNTYTKAVKEILRFKKAMDKVEPKIPKKLVGDLGELYALNKLEMIRLRPERKGGHGSYDIYLKGIKKRIEVRTSLWKNEGVYKNESILFWGWKVENRNQKRSGKFDYLVCVGLTDEFTNPRFYVFTYQEAFKVGDVEIGRFKNVKKKIHLFKNKNSYIKALKLKPEYITPFERQINRFPSRFLNQWKKIK